MPQELYILAVLDGLSYAALLFLVALGMTLVFGVMNIINMAHGSFYALGGYMAASLGLWASSMGASPAWALLILPLSAVIVGCLFGGLMAYGGWTWAVAKWDEKKPMLPVPDGIDYVPLVIAGVLIVLFSIEHIIALVRGTVVEPAWN